ncbi:hypothetical protein FOL47_002357 [Perkinsus chesapeaki]|uniref:Peptidase A1 domain-containing protein n=1 Tax=Perkinsus chesapeaki TaxID=330153 RepID=A0A7J6MF19_PERCH|nr:hypothetical protein FOL47_002357 [Perkinsus chesapeaki]
MRTVEWHGIHTEALISQLKVDGHSLRVAVDTGVYETFFFSNRSLIDGEPCDGLFYGCYQCEPKYCDESKEIAFCDGCSAYVTGHSGTLELGGVRVPGANFGLVVNFTSAEVLPQASLGLAFKPEGDDENGDWMPLLSQLVDKGILDEKEFSIYFDPDNINEGELILGGQDTTKYHKPMQQVPLTVGEDSWTVDLKSIKVGGKPVHTISNSHSIMIDSGADGLYAPPELIRPVLAAIESNLLARGRNIEYASHPWSLHSLQSCDDRLYLPPIQLALQGESDAEVIVEIPEELYVSKSSENGECYLLIKDVPEGCGIGVNLLRPYHLQYQEEHRRIGIALAKRRPRTYSGSRMQRFRRFKRSLLGACSSCVSSQSAG